MDEHILAATAVGLNETVPFVALRAEEFEDRTLGSVVPANKKRASSDADPLDLISISPQ
jgi:hypothetical protein